jgi:hypothetical protein
MCYGRSGRPCRRLWRSSDEGARRATLVAQARLSEAVKTLHAQGVHADGELGHPEPLAALGDALAACGPNSGQNTTKPKAQCCRKSR